MKTPLALVLVAFLGLLAGCESLESRVRDRFAEVPPKTQVVDGEARAVYAAVQAAFKRLDFNLTRSSITDLRVEAASRINTSVAFADSRQLVAQVTIADVGPAQSEVSMRLTEQVEAQGLGGPTERALREHGFYETYFAVLQQVLAEQKAAPAGRKN
ncbi:MAG: hypothetical protein KF715_02925 [Candidatus Didemnitutus sp.]|nr:hypothetical protein [Candidatus Didemnitutus sp.]